MTHYNLKSSASNFFSGGEERGARINGLYRNFLQVPSGVICRFREQVPSPSILVLWLQYSQLGGILLPNSFFFIIKSRSSRLLGCLYFSTEEILFPAFFCRIERRRATHNTTKAMAAGMLPESVPASGSVVEENTSAVSSIGKIRRRI